MKLTDFDYQISHDQIAQHPLPERDSSRLMVVHKNSGNIEHRIFRDIADCLLPGDLLVLNNARVIPARIFGTKPSGGEVEIMLLKELDKNIWEALVKGQREGKVILENGAIATVSRGNGASAKVTFAGAGLKPVPTDIKNVLSQIGVMPLPPYIKREAVRADAEKYQTVYAEKEGAVAAPTAGLHFTDRLLNIIREKGVDIKTVTLYVGYGTFKPITANDISEHKMDEEFYEIPEATAEAINRAKAEGRRVIAVGTTVTRALESGVGKQRAKGEGQKKDNTPLTPLIRGEFLMGRTSIFIYPGYNFKIIDALVTNFHQPRSTPMMLTSAFAGLELLKQAYAAAQTEGYRFFSYGDAMMIM
ncbi:MAG: tRNA preQ1(34) S-adenosylmethionine ribosyltransferase-isomerase QueA [Nitrospirae bacterium]|nr:tRNA preQ1(34) S-adenosylmethionine ribosyltransferase-isomerase QueA [Nitrospirota bacterium]